MSTCNVVGCQHAHTDDLVLFERMPNQHRSSHQAAGNWGTYPHNGAERVLLTREEAKQLAADDTDEYDHIVRDATPEDEHRYDREF